MPVLKMLLELTVVINKHYSCIPHMYSHFISIQDTMVSVRKNVLRRTAAGLLLMYVSL